LVQQEPFSTGTELAGCGGVYAMTCVANTAGAVCVEVEVVWFVGAVMCEGAKNCPTPKSTTRASTTTTIILLVLFISMIFFYLHKFERADDILHQ
jgi:TRAP-type C4-dicarboxylate transport system permease large subunit